jgi:serine/threonine protein kinase/tetratricopeptide (TPR) repeat protein
MIGQTLGHYRIVEKIGAGGMGEVYRARDEHLERDVALKVLPAGTLADEAVRRRFRKEALALSKLNHPNIATVFDFDSQHGVDFLAMELIPGSTLSGKLADGPLVEREVLRLGAQLAEGLAGAHAQGVVHRDLKPGNLIITPDGRLKILDFGLATLLHPSGDPDLTRSITETTSVSGTLPYMSPEQLRGQPVDARSDVYAAGAVLYEMASGHRAFPQRQGAELIGAILHQSPTSLGNQGISPALGNVMMKALEKEPSQRYQSARELLVALEGVGMSIAAVTSGGAVPGSLSATGVASTARQASERKEDGSAEAASKKRRYRRGILISTVTTAAVVLVVLFLRHYRAHALTEKDTMVLADFSNTTGDPVFDGTLRQGLTVQLEQSPFLSLISDQRIQQTLRLMGQPPDARLTPEIARELCQRTESAAVLDGSIASLGSQYVLGLAVVNCLTGDSLAQEQVTADGKERVLKALGEAATKLRAKLGESLSTVEKFDTPLEQATTPSLEALQAYSLGWKTRVGRGDSAAAVPLFQRAIRLDPNFAMAYASLATSYYVLGEASLAAENTRKAYELRERVSEREKFYIESQYHFSVTGDLEKARQAYELWAQTYPRDEVPPRDLGTIYDILGQYDKALAQYREAFRLDPASGLNYANLVSDYLYLNRPREARATAEEAQTKNLDSPILRSTLYQLAFLQNDAAGMAQQVAWAAGKPGVEGVLLLNEADTAAYSGRLGKAREFSRRAVASAQRAGEKETAASFEAGAAVREAFFGNFAEARQQAAAALALSKGRDVQYWATLALVWAGDAARAHALADDLDKRFPEDTIVQFNYLPTIHALLALSRNDSAKAVEALDTAAPYELAPGGGLYPVYVRGEANLAARQGSQAAVEFQKILAHRNVVLNDPMGALTQLGLARAYALQGDTGKARAVYQDFLSLWKDADPDIPILIAAKSEYAKLPTR